MRLRAWTVILILTFLAQLILNTIQGMTYFQSMVATGIGTIMMLILDRGSE